MGNEASVNCAPEGGQRYGASNQDGKSDGLPLVAGEGRWLPRDLEERPLVFGLFSEDPTVAVCVLLGEREEVIARLGPGSLLSAPGIGLDYASGSEVFNVTLASLPECVHSVVFAAALDDSGSGATSRPSGEAFMALCANEDAPKPAATGLGRPGCTTVCKQESERAGVGRPRAVPLAKTRVELQAGGPLAYFTLRSGGGGAGWQIQAAAGPLQLPAAGVASSALTARPMDSSVDEVEGAEAPGTPPHLQAARRQVVLKQGQQQQQQQQLGSKEVLPVPDMRPAPASSKAVATRRAQVPELRERVRSLEAQLAFERQKLAFERQKYQQLAQWNTQAHEWNRRVVDKVEAKQYELEVWRRQALVWVKALDSKAVLSMLEDKGSWPLAVQYGDMDLAELHGQLAKRHGKEITCPQGHELTAWTSTAYGYKCDVCTKRLPLGSVLHCCRACGYDECHSCFSSNLQKVIFTKLDANGDGVISQEEFEAAMAADGAPAGRLRLPPGLCSADQPSSACAMRDAEMSMTILNLSYDKLTSDVKLLDSFETAVKQGVASELGAARLSPEHIKLELSAGSVIVKARVRPPPGVSKSLVCAGMVARSSAIGSAVANAVSSLDNIASASTGPLSVTNISVPQDSLETPRTEPPTTARSAQVPPLDLAQVVHRGGQAPAATPAAAAAHSRASEGSCTSLESSVRVPEGAELIDVVVDLSRPFGVLFSNDLTVRAVKEKSQGERLNIRVGYIVVSASSLALKSLSGLEAYVGYLRSQGKQSIPVQFAKPKSLGSAPRAAAGLAHELPASQSSGERDLDHLSREDFRALQRSPEVQTIDLSMETPPLTPSTSPEGSQPNPPSLPPVECMLDMSLPWGLLIGDDMHVQSVQEDSQAGAAGIGHGWKVLAVEGQRVSNMHAMREKLASLKSSARSIKLTFEPCDDDDSSEEEESADGASS